jgi:hypothetical protein
MDMETYTKVSIGFVLFILILEVVKRVFNMPSVVTAVLLFVVLVPYVIYAMKYLWARRGHIKEQNLSAKRWAIVLIIGISLLIVLKSVVLRYVTERLYISVVVGSAAALGFTLLYLLMKK